MTDAADGRARFPLEPVDTLAITTLVDNVADLTLADQGPARRFSMGRGPRRPAAFMDGGATVDTLRAEHGFSALVTVTISGRPRRLLFDTGVSPEGMVENMRRMDLSPRDVEALVLSHGHFDHTTGLDGLARDLGRRNLPVMIHPEFWNRRRTVVPGREPFELPTTSRSALRGAGFEVTEERRPSFLFERALLITGEVDRTTLYEPGLPGQEKWEAGRWQPDPLTLDDQALIVHVRGRGLVVMTGCGHAGIVNIIRYACRLTGISRVHAVLGGFHLGGPKFEPVIPEVCSALAEAQPDVIVPAHCTGWRAMHQFGLLFPEAFIQNSVGTTFTFTAPTLGGTPV